MVNLEKYKNDGWGLSKKIFENIHTILDTFKPNHVNVVEFGSGISTEFLVDMINDGHNLNIVSYDNDIQYSTKAVHENLKLYVTDLIECFDSDFNSQFVEKYYNSKFFSQKLTEVHTRQKNTFYNVKAGELPDVIDLMILDGPHGNGRSIAFLHCIDRIKTGSHIIIDDYNHYDFVVKFKMLFPESELVYSSNTGQHNQWELGGNYVIYKIL